VNADTFVCERIVWGQETGAEPFDRPVMDIVASDVREIGGAMMPATYTLRLFAGSAPYFALETKLQDIAVKGAGNLADSEFDAWAQSPGPLPVVLRPTANIEELEALVSKKEMDTGAWLSLAFMYATATDFERAKQTLDGSEELFNGKATAEFERGRAKFWGDLEQDYVAFQLQQLPQLERIYADRADKLRARGDGVHADQMAAKSAEYRQAKEAAMARAEQLNAAE
jgi:hypothetical protein